MQAQVVRGVRIPGSIHQQGHCAVKTPSMVRRGTVPRPEPWWLSSASIRFSDRLPAHPPAMYLHSSS
jgi:hypothetical protein